MHSFEAVSQQIYVQYNSWNYNSLWEQGQEKKKKKKPEEHSVVEFYLLGI